MLIPWQAGVDAAVPATGSRQAEQLVWQDTSQHGMINNSNAIAISSPCWKTLRILLL
jgi:hypothetical protein